MIATIQSCNGHKFNENDKASLEPGPGLEEQNQSLKSTISETHINSNYLDTLKLKEIGISFQRIGANSNYDTWLLKLKDTIPKSKQIQAITYDIVANLSKADGYLLFQLDSVRIKLPKKIIAYGFNEDGPYMHSYESLQKPEVEFDDYNFDNIVDFSVQSGGSGTNELRYYYIFNAKTGIFNKSIVMANASFDRQKKLVYQSWHLSSAEGGQSTYKFTSADTLIMTRSRNKYYVDSLDSYVIEFKTLQSNGKYLFTSDTVKRK